MSVDLDGELLHTLVLAEMNKVVPSVIEFRLTVVSVSLITNN